MCKCIYLNILEASSQLKASVGFRLSRDEMIAFCSFDKNSGETIMVT